jgi:hypothetical protein
MWIFARPGLSICNFLHVTTTSLCILTVAAQLAPEVLSRGRESTIRASTGRSSDSRLALRELSIGIQLQVPCQPQGTQDDMPSTSGRGVNSRLVLRELSKGIQHQDCRPSQETQEDMSGAQGIDSITDTFLLLPFQCPGQLGGI